MGDARPGDNLYTNSVLALDASTGAIAGYHQYHWNGSWDWDEIDPPLLIDIERDGRAIPALVHPGRNGYLWILERRAVPASASSTPSPTSTRTPSPPSTRAPDARRTTPEHTPGTGRPASFCPSLTGGKNWPPAAFNPRDAAALHSGHRETSAPRWRAARSSTRRGACSPGPDPATRIRDGAEHLGELQAWNLDSGELAWAPGVRVARTGAPS